VYDSGWPHWERHGGSQRPHTIPNRYIQPRRQSRRWIPSPPLCARSHHHPNHPLSTTIPPLHSAPADQESDTMRFRTVARANKLISLPVSLAYLEHDLAPGRTPQAEKAAESIPQALLNVQRPPWVSLRQELDIFSQHLGDKEGPSVRYPCPRTSASRFGFPCTSDPPHCITGRPEEAINRLAGTY